MDLQNAAWLFRSCRSTKAKVHYDILNFFGSTIVIDLSQCSSASPLVHSVDVDPGVIWLKEAAVAIEAPPDSDTNPCPEATWPAQAHRSGLCGAVGPRAIALPRGGYRMYYSQMLPRPGFPAGANDYDNASTRILSAYSADGESWTPEPGVRLSPQQAGAGDFRVVSSEVVPVGDGRQLRMYVECCRGPQSSSNAICSAISSDGLTWTMEPGVRVESTGHNYSSPRIIFLEDSRCRMYLFDRGHGIISLISHDGFEFHPESGLRIAQDGPHDAYCAFAAEIVHVTGSGYVMYYAGYSRPGCAHILRATSLDGITWQKAPEPVIAPGPGGWDAAKASEMCLIRLPAKNQKPTRYRLFYEACDGTAVNARGVWRIASATSV